MSTLWDELKKHIKEQLPEKSYSLWINPLSLIDEKEDSIVLGCPNKFSMNWIIDHYSVLMESSLRNMGMVHNIIYKVSTQARKKKEPDMFLSSPQLNLPIVSPRKTRGKIHFNKEFTFDEGNCIGRWMLLRLSFYGSKHGPWKESSFSVHRAYAA